MHITVINGVPDENYREHEKAISKALQKLRENNVVNYFIVREMDIEHCIGCFGCWVKTPGLCVIKDDMEKLLRSQAKTDFVLYISPLCAGFISSKLKDVLDRSIPLLLPYIDLIKGECHHPKRYDNNIKTGIIILDAGRLNKSAVDITFEIFDRNALNFHSSKVLKRTANPKEMEEVFNEINCC